MNANNADRIYGEQHQPADHGKGSFGGRHGHRPQFTEEEKRVLQDCKRNSLIRGAVGGVAAWGILHFIKDSYLGPFAKYKRTLKGVAVVSGFFYGMVSYADTCRKNILALPDSPLAEEYKRKIAAASSRFGLPEESDETHFHAITDVIYDAQAQEQHQPSDTRYATDAEKDLHNEDGEKQQVTFAELRQQNRQQYDPARQPLRRPPHGLQPPPSAPEQNTDQFSLDEHTPSSNYSSDTDLSSPIPERKPTASDYPQQTKTWTQATNRKNLYGDEME